MAATGGKPSSVWQSIMSCIWAQKHVYNVLTSGMLPPTKQLQTYGTNRRLCYHMGCYWLIGQWTIIKLEASMCWPLVTADLVDPTVTLITVWHCTVTLVCTGEWGTCCAATCFPSSIKLYIKRDFLVINIVLCFWNVLSFKSLVFFTDLIKILKGPEPFRQQTEMWTENCGYCLVYWGDTLGTCGLSGSRDRWN